MKTICRLHTVLVFLILSGAFLHLNAQSNFYKFIDLSPANPTDYFISQCWNAMGMDSSNNLYVGFLFTKTNQPDNCGVFKYSVRRDTVTYLGQFIDVLKSANNYPSNTEAVPKGHTEWPFINGKLYIGTMPFHEVCKAPPYLSNMNLYGTHRGSHLFSIDTGTNRISDLSVNKPGGVFQPYQGIVGIQIIPDSGSIAMYSEPAGDLMVYSISNDNFRVVARGDSTYLGQRIGRSITTYKSKVFYEIGWGPMGLDNSVVSKVFRYDLSTRALKQLTKVTSGGFWMPRAQTKDGRYTYILTILGNLYKLDAEADSISFITNVEKGDLEYVHADGTEPYKLYCLALNPQETKLYLVPSIGLDITTKPQTGHLVEYNLQTKCLIDFGLLSNGVYTGNNVRDREGRIYFTWHDYSGHQGRLLQLDVTKLPAGDTLRKPGITGIHEVEVAGVTEVGTNYPNPFNPSTIIPYELATEQHVTITVYDILGRQIAVLVDNNETAGRHHAVFNAQGLSSGIYVYQFRSNHHVENRHMLFIK